MASNDNLVDQAKRIVRQINGNTTVPQSQTREDLEMVKEEIEELLAALED